MRPEEANLGLALQRMPAMDRILCLAQLASMQSEGGEFGTNAVMDLVDAFRLPRPGNPSGALARLRDNRPALLRRRLTTGWLVTPEGNERARLLLGERGLVIAAAEMNASWTALFAHGRYPTLPPMLAPPAWRHGLRAFLEQWPFERNVLLMTRFPVPGAHDSLAVVIETLRRTVRDHGLHLHVASDRQILDDVWGNVGAHMWGCRFGIGVLETLWGSRPGQSGPELGPIGGHRAALSHNVVIELGSMLTLGRRCMILRDRGAPLPPTDLTAQIYKTVDLTSASAVASAASQWIVEDLGLGEARTS